MELGGFRVFVLFILFKHISSRRHDYSLFSLKFISVNLDENFHRELRISHGRIILLETSAFLDSPEMMVVRRITNGRRIVQLVFQNGDLKDCEYTTNRRLILRLVDDFSRAKKLLSRSNSSDVFQSYFNSELLTKGPAVRRIKSKSDLLTFSSFVDLKHQAKMCHELVEKFKKQASRRQHKKDKKSSKKGPVYSRFKRDIFSGWLIFPGTKWCGDGDVASSFDDLGYDEKTDACCRDHDNCPHIIERFAYKYNLFNYRFHTLSHCSCDFRFRRCLKKSRSPTAKLIGRIFFNIMSPQCFRFKKERVCKKRTWWGTCKKYGKKRSAFPRDSRGF